MRLTNVVSNIDVRPAATDICSSVIWMSHVIERITNQTMPSLSMPTGMTFVRMWALTAIAQEASQGNAIRMSDIAAELGITPRSATAVVDGLEQLGFVSREADGHDRRSVRVAMTKAAEALLPTMREAWDAICDQICGPLDANERTVLLGLMLKLINPV